MDAVHYVVVEYSRIECEVVTEVIGVAHTYEDAVKILNHHKSTLSFDGIFEDTGYVIDEDENEYSFFLDGFPDEDSYELYIAKVGEYNFSKKR